MILTRPLEANRSNRYNIWILEIREDLCHKVNFWDILYISIYSLDSSGSIAITHICRILITITSSKTSIGRISMLPRMIITNNCFVLLSETESIFCKISFIVLSPLCCVQVPLSFDSRVVRSIQSRCKRNVATKRILVTFLLQILHFRRTWTASQVQSKYRNSTFKVGQ